VVHRIVVAGAGYSGLTAALRLARRLTRRTDAEVVLVNATDRFVERVRLHQVAAGQDVGEHPLPDVLRGSGVRLVVARVLAIDPERHELHLDGPDGAERLHYDTLVHAIGSGPAAGAVPGAAEHAIPVAHLDGARELRKRAGDLAAEGGTLTVVGGGLSGIETATELAETHSGLRVRLLTSAEPGATLSPRARAHLRRVFDRLGVEVRTGVTVAEVRPDAVVLGDGETVPTDLTVWTTGFSVPQLARRAGIATDPDGRVLVDATLRSVSHPDVYAVGDSALGRTLRGDVLRMSCATGLPTGQYVADVVAARLIGREPEPLRFRYYIQCVSLGRRDGLIQLVDADDRPKDTVLTGRAAATVKELVVRGAAWTTQHPGPYGRR
jgi:NADH:ubiquinone reductase (H+-translocating)